MQAFKTKRSLFSLLCALMLGSMVSSCGQMGPLTLPQPPAEVAVPEQNNTASDENSWQKAAGEPSGSF
ncbi:LPS translocon maturation chaperone LptM [Rheinheimera sp. WS51]|uniref:LPS translocon maturation chaperone LptM n=1 Tax=Rheinheimera sp. WS51 TaxID=3425886 RepID=UPI003D8E8DC0